MSYKSVLPKRCLNWIKAVSNEINNLPIVNDKGIEKNDIKILHLLSLCHGGF